MKRKTFYLLIIFTLFFITRLNSQDFNEDGKPLVSFKSPYKTIFVHIQYLHKEFYNPKISAKSFNPEKNELDSAVKLAINLKKIFDGKGIIIDMASISRDSNYVDSITGLARYTPLSQLPDIYLEKVGNKWFYSQHTIKIIPLLYNEMYPYEISGLVDRLPEYFQISFVYLAIWQWAGLIILIFLSFLIYIVFDKIIIYFLFKFWNRFVKREIVSSSLKRLSHPLGFLFILTLFAKFLPILSLPLKFSYFFNLIFAFAIPLIITYIIYRITDYVSEFFAKIADKTPSKLDDKIVPLVRKFLKVVVVIFGALYVLKNIGIDITPLLAGVSIGSLAVALAAQETLKNMFGSLTLFSDRVFELGDWIIAEDVDGRVEQVGIRSTKVRSFNDSIITVPNGKLADMNINNMGKRKYRRFATNLSVTYDTSISKIEEFIEGIRTIVNNHEKTRKDYLRVYLNNLGDSAIMILFDIFFEVEDYDEELKAKHEILSSIMNLASQLSVDFAFPTQTLHLEKGKSWVGSEKSEDSKSKHLHEDV